MTWEKELKQLNKKYWLYEREQYKMKLEKPHGPWVREYEMFKRMRQACRLVPECFDCATAVSCYGIRTASCALGIAELNVDAVFEIENSTNQI